MPLLDIEKLTFGGAGLGRIDGKACFVPYTAPGDKAEIELSTEKKSYTTGILKGLQHSSSLRVPPVCPVFGSCGGCNWQHIEYAAQCSWKERIFAETVWRMARIDGDIIKPLLSAGKAFNYRQRIQLKLYNHKGGLHVGFYRNGSHYVVDIDGNCPIATDCLNRAISGLKSVVALSSEPGMIPQIDLAAGEDGSVVALFHYIGNSPETFAGYLLGQRGQLPGINAAFMQTGRKNSLKKLFGSGQLSYTLPDISGRNIELAYSIDTFSQINFSQNRVLAALFIELFLKIAPRRVLDIYCGNGNLSLPIAASSVDIVGIEASEKSVALARENAAQAGFNNVQFFSGDAENCFDNLAASGQKFDLLILDPPRSGAHNLVKKLSQVGPSYVVYVSCDPVTLARDLALLQKKGFRVANIQPVDMFPQTYHVESITLLELC